VRKTYKNPGVETGADLTMDDSGVRAVFYQIVPDLGRGIWDFSSASWLSKSRIAEASKDR